MSALDELLGNWRTNPNATLTIALCAELGGTRRTDLAREVGASAETWHARDSAVALAVGRMYLECGLLAEAQNAFVNAGKLDPDDALVFRLLGETLLRRGDAVRAEKVLARARSLDPSDAAVEALCRHTVTLVVTQKRSGVQAAATQAKRLLSVAPSRKPAPAPPTPAAPKPPPARAKDAPLPRFQSEDPVEVSEVFERETAPRADRGKVARAPSADEITEIVGDGLPRFDDVSAVDMSHFASSAEVVNGSHARAGAASGHAPVARAPTPPIQARRAHVGGGAPGSPLARQPAVSPQPPPFREAPSRAPSRPVPASAPRAPEGPPLLPTVPVEQRAFLGAEVLEPAGADVLGRRHEAEANPSPALVFEHLARVGVFEPAGGAPPAWEAAPRQKSRGIIPLVLGIVLLSGAGAGGYEYARRIKTERAAQAELLTAEVRKLLHTGKLDDLRATDEKLSRAFDLDSRSHEAGRLWLENRVLRALLLAEEPRGLDSAVHRGRTVGLREKDLAVGRVASFLAQGDLAGAAALLSKWDAEAGQDAYYQLTAGAVLERAGDPRAVERYEAARRLDPKLVVTDILLARLLLLEYGVARAKTVLEELPTKRVEPTALRALTALAWVVDPERTPTPPEGARLSADEAKRLPSPLSAIPWMLDAVEAMQADDRSKAGDALDRAISLAQGPALPTTLGLLAIETGDEALARKAALRALSFAALYPRARTLAARVALLGGRIDEAQRAVEELDPKSQEVAVVRAVIAYETADVAELESALAVLAPGAGTPAFAGLAAAPGVLGGRYPETKSLTELAEPSLPWGRLVALDAALDTGNLGLAEELASRGTTSPVLALRVARLRRYQKKLDEALAASERAFDGKPTTPLLVERAYELLESDRVAEARDLVAKYPALLGPVSGWLGVLIDAASSQPKKATLRLATLEPFPDETPVFLRVLVGRAFAAGADKRARPYLVQLARRLGRHPDVVAALEAVR